MATLRSLLVTVAVVGAVLCHALDIESDLAHVRTLFEQHGISDTVQCNTTRILCAVDEDGNEYVRELFVFALILLFAWLFLRSHIVHCNRRLSDTPIATFPDFDFGLFQKLAVLFVANTHHI